MRNSIAARISTCFLRRGSTSSLSSSTFRLPIPTTPSKTPFLAPALVTFGKNSIFGPSAARFASYTCLRLLHTNPDGTEEFRHDSASDDSNGEVEPIDSWEEEDEVEAEVGDGGDGGGVVLQNCPWGEKALSIAKQVLLEFGEGMELYAFKTSPRGYVYVRLDKVSNVYGCPSMDEIELFNRQYKKKLDEIGAGGEIPDDLAIEVSSPGADRLLRVPDDLLRFKDMPMVVLYMQDSGTRCPDKTGVYFLDSLDAESSCSVWRLADVRENRDPAAKGRSLSRKQKDLRVKIPYGMIKRVTLYISY